MSVPPTPRRSAPPAGRERTNQALLAIVLVVVGAVAALGFERLVPGIAPGAVPATATPAASADIADPFATDAAVSDDPGLSSDAPSDAPIDSAQPPASPAAPILDAAMPRAVNGTPLTVETDLGSTILGNDPGSRSFAAAVSTLGVSSDKLEIGFAYDDAGSLPLSVLGFRIAGVSAARLRPLVLESWLSGSAPGVKSSNVTLSGTPVIRVSYGDEGSDEYVFVHGDVVFIVETSDQTLATAVIKSIVGAPAAASPSAS